MKIPEGIITHKKCTKCKQIKSVNDFTVYKRTKDGRQYRCKACHSEDGKKYKARTSNRLSFSDPTTSARILEELEETREVWE